MRFKFLNKMATIFALIAALSGSIACLAGDSSRAESVSSSSSVSVQGETATVEQVDLHGCQEDCPPGSSAHCSFHCVHVAVVPQSDAKALRPYSEVHQGHQFIFALSRPFGPGLRPPING